MFIRVLKNGFCIKSSIRKSNFVIENKARVSERIDSTNPADNLFFFTINQHLGETLIRKFWKTIVYFSILSLAFLFYYLSLLLFQVLFQLYFKISLLQHLILWVKLHFSIISSCSILVQKHKFYIFELSKSCFKLLRS